MLGNFSFGDYFKEDAIKFAWDFLVNELGLEESRLWFSYFGGDAEVPMDEEARDLWIKVGARPERVLPFGRKDNFWQMGDTGPCGPCSEIHYYMGDDPDDPEKNRAEYVNADDGDLTMEIWNLVFMQFERSEAEKGVFTLTPLPAPREDGELVTSGIFARVRHPLYASVMAMGFGWALLWGSRIALAPATFLALYIHAKARREERLLRARFPAYPAYAAGVPRYLPSLPSLRWPFHS